MPKQVKLGLVAVAFLLISPLLDVAFESLGIDINLVDTVFAACELDEYGNEINCDGGGGSGGGSSSNCGTTSGFHECGTIVPHTCTARVCLIDWLPFTCETVWWVDSKCIADENLTTSCGYVSTVPECNLDDQ